LPNRVAGDRFGFAAGKIHLNNFFLSHLIPFNTDPANLDGSENRPRVFSLSDTNSKFFRPAIRNRQDSRLDLDTPLKTRRQCRRLVFETGNALQREHWRVIREPFVAVGGRAAALREGLLWERNT
jgi:hypothetical protein